MKLRSLATGLMWRQVRRGFNPWWWIALALWAVVSRLIFPKERSSR